MPDHLPLEQALREIPAFSDLEPEQLQWFIAQSEEVFYEPGDTLINPGDPAELLIVMLEGEIQGKRITSAGDGPIFTAQAGQVTGLLPFSRMTVFEAVVRAVSHCRIVQLHKDRFDEMLQRIPQLLPRLVAMLSDRIREVSRTDQQREKLMALGKLSAGLAHELNNPASAARRAAESLRHCTRELRCLTAKLESYGCSPVDLHVVTEAEDRLVENLASVPVRDSLQQADLEDLVTSWLDDRGIRRKAIDPAVLVEAGVDEMMLDQLEVKFKGPVLSDVIARIATTISVERLAVEIENSTNRISELVRAVKEYSFMDQMPEQEVDVHHGIDNTLIMLKFRWKHGITVQRNYDPTLPRIHAFGSELNQVWTNLLENAIDAMEGKGELQIRTSRELDAVLVEITDNGPGIPEEVQPHIFEPFYTTKGFGSGTGLGLDTVYRIIQKHRGAITFTSKPGETKFQIRLWPQAKPAN